MPRLETFTVALKTGESSLQGSLQFVINGFPLEFEQKEGGTGPGETLNATGNPGSFPHSLLLRGPESGEWDIEDLRVTYTPFGEEPYSVRFGSITLDASSDLNIWADRPAPVFDV